MSAATATPAVIGDVDDVLTTTRAVRKRLDLDRPVGREVIDTCVEIARQAPIAENRDVCRFVVVQDAELRRGVAEVYRLALEDFVFAPMRAKAAARAAEGNDAPARTPDPQMARVMVSGAFLAERLQDVPALILVGSVDRAPKQAVGAWASGFYGSIYPTVWSLQLALRSRGLGSSLTCIHLHHAQLVADLLGLPETFTQVALLPVAYTQGLDFKPAARKLSQDDVLFWDRWDGR